MRFYQQQQLIDNELSQNDAVNDFIVHHLPTSAAEQRTKCAPDAV
jgi:hypothetical protein